MCHADALCSAWHIDKLLLYYFIKGNDRILGLSIILLEDSRVFARTFGYAIIDELGR